MKTGKVSKIRLLLTDVDGVLTDGGIAYSSSKEEIKVFNVKDGYICQTLLSNGVKLGIITGRKSDIVERRAKELGFEYLFQGVKDKMEVLNSILDMESISLSEVAYIGDDLNDLDILKVVGLSATPNDAFDYIKSEVDFLCKRKGGKGAFREFADLILEQNG